MQAEYELVNQSDCTQGPMAEKKQPRTETTKTTTETETNPISTPNSITVRKPAITSLKGNVYPLLVVGLYTSIALAAWIIICVTSKRPIRRGQSYTERNKYALEPNFHVNEEYIKAASFLQNIATVLTIPVTSGVCSMAAVIYMQASTMRQSLNVQQLMALADQGWISPRVWKSIWRVGSTPFYFAFGLTMIGSVSQIFQASLYTREVIRVPKGSVIPKSLDVKDIPPMSVKDDVLKDAGEQVLRLRRMLDLVSEKDVDVNLWSPNAAWEEWNLGVLDSSKWSNRPKPSFFSELPNNFSTGLLGPQYAPRMNSTTTVVLLSEQEFHTSCRNETENGGFYAHHLNKFGHVEDDLSLFSVTVCMPGDKRISPWKPTRDRQDITEELFIGFNLSSQASVQFKIQTDSSLGYFELPSYKNSLQAGPLLEKDPYPNGTPHPGAWIKLFGKHKRQEFANVTSSGNHSLTTVGDSGPLTLVTYALFGEGSFIDTPPKSEADEPQANICIDMAPLNSILRTGCAFVGNVSANRDSLLRDWVSRISAEQDLQKAMTLGVWLATKTWLGPQYQGTGSRERFPIFADEGIVTFKPKISNGNIIAASLLLALHLLGLWVLGIAATFMRTWTKTLGAEAMLKVGMAHAVQLSTAGNAWEHQSGLLPGYIGDARPDGPVGRMEMGATHKLVGGRDYELLR